MQEVLQDLEFYEKQSMLDNFEINRLRCELQTSMNKVEKERANSWARIVGLASAGAVAASTMTLGTAASGAAMGSSTAMFGASAAFTSAATATTAAAAATSSAAVTASAAMIGTGAAMGVAAETAAVGAALSCVIS